MTDDGYLPPHQPHCLGCGDENPGSMGLRLRIDDDRVKGEVTFDRRQEGAPGFAHGGAVATVLDDTVGTLLVLLRRPAVTAKLEIDYRRPAFLGRPFEVEAHVERTEDRKLWLAADLRDGDDVVAEARALYVVVAAEHFLEGGEDPTRSWRVHVEETGFGLPW